MNNRSADNNPLHFIRHGNSQRSLPFIISSAGNYISMATGKVQQTDHVVLIEFHDGEREVCPIIYELDREQTLAPLTVIAGRLEHNPFAKIPCTFKLIRGVSKALLMNINGHASFNVRNVFLLEVRDLSWKRLPVVYGHRPKLDPNTLAREVSIPREIRAILVLKPFKEITPKDTEQ